MTPRKWTVLSSRVLSRSKWVTLRQDKCKLPNGQVLDDYFVCETMDYCMVVAVTPDKKILLAREYKHAVSEVILQLPAGYVDGQDGSPKAAVRRELEEETGYVAAKVSDLGVYYPSPGRLNNRMHLYLAEGLKKTGTQSWDDTEEIEIVQASLPHCLKLIKQGKIKDQASVLGILLCMDKIK